MTAQSIIKMYATHPHECSYLPYKEATTVFIDPAALITPEIYKQLSEQGFRRSGAQLYKPHCENCVACIPVRVPVALFKPKRSQRRIFNKNRDLQVVVRNDIDAPEFYALYERYINQKHRDGDMYPADPEQFETFLTSEWNVTRYFCFYQQEQLVAVAVADQLDDCLSAIYTFYDPDLDRRSLGSYAILWQIEKAHELGLRYLYLGYWIESCRKMSYKTQYRPIELYLKDQWIKLT